MGEVSSYIRVSTSPASSAEYSLRLPGVALFISERDAREQHSQCFPGNDNVTFGGAMCGNIFLRRGIVLVKFISADQKSHSAQDSCNIVTKVHAALNSSPLSE